VAAYRLISACAWAWLPAASARRYARSHGGGDATWPRPSTSTTLVTCSRTSPARPPVAYCNARDRCPSVSLRSRQRPSLRWFAALSAPFAPPARAADHRRTLGRRRRRRRATS
jgi:hypothetical protein